ncbi:Hypothetical protein NTJ_15250 [Nesidiocoris tenuis]|uniref:Uncharacterized protein n=1 Tax=Nesidiocoris tenuis TaxID=355587 RepID=A0ABN7BDI0_9HEMI|nr:Hypothetical protein NTJ_15250 [Nesidiocoris tenuis]
MPRSLRSYGITEFQKPSGAHCATIRSIVSGDRRFKSSLPQSQSQVTGSYGVTGFQKPSEAHGVPIWSIVSGDRRFKSSLSQSQSQVTGIRWNHRISETIRSSRCHYQVRIIRRHEIQELSAFNPNLRSLTPMESQDFRNHQKLTVFPSAP